MLFHSDTINYDDENRLRCIYKGKGFYDPFNQNGYTDVCQEVAKLCEKANVDMPNLYVLDEHQVGAQTSIYSKNHIICVTSGALNRLNNQQLSALLAHEIAHIKLANLHKDRLGKVSERLADKIGTRLTSPLDMISLLNFYRRNHDMEVDSNHDTDDSRIQNIKAQQSHHLKRSLIKIIMSKLKHTVKRTRSFLKE